MTIFKEDEHPNIKQHCILRVSVCIESVPKRRLHTLTPESSILKTKCTVINTAFIILQSLGRHLRGGGEHPVFSNNSIYLENGDVGHLAQLQGGVESLRATKDYKAISGKAFPEFLRRSCKQPFSLCPGWFAGPEESKHDTHPTGELWRLAIIRKPLALALIRSTHPRS